MPMNVNYAEKSLFSPGIDFCTSSCGFGVTSLWLTSMWRGLPTCSGEQILFEWFRATGVKLLDFSTKDWIFSSVGRENRLFGRSRLNSTNRFLMIIGRLEAGRSKIQCSPVLLHKNPKHEELLTASIDENLMLFSWGVEHHDLLFKTYSKYNIGSCTVCPEPKSESEHDGKPCARRINVIDWLNFYESIW